MLERQDLPTSEKSAAVIYKLIVYSLEHIYVYFRKLKLLQSGKALVCLVEINALAHRYLVTLGMEGY